MTKLVIKHTRKPQGNILRDHLPSGWKESDRKKKQEMHGNGTNASPFLFYLEIGMNDFYGQIIRKHV